MIDPIREQQMWDANPVEYVLEDGRRFAWSESNVQYEEVPPDGGSFTLLRNRLSEVENQLKAIADMVNGKGIDLERYHHDSLYHAVADLKAHH